MATTLFRVVRGTKRFPQGLTLVFDEAGKAVCVVALDANNEVAATFGRECLPALMLALYARDIEPF